MARYTMDWRAELLWLLDAYRAMLPVRKLMVDIKARYERDAQWTLLEFQDAVVDVVIHDTVADKYAPQRSYTYRFLKAYTDAIEREYAELSDALVAELMEFVVVGHVPDMITAEAEEMHHVTYRVPANAAGTEHDLTVTCRVASVFNEVGLKIWEAGWFLAEYVLAYRDLFEGSTVLELGAGVGFTGFVLAKCVAVKRLVMSDYAPKVMLNLIYNTELNALEAPYKCPVEVETIDWDTWSPHETSKGLTRPDILLAGDCVYDIAAFPSLVRVLQLFLGGEHDENETNSPARFAIFAATIRNQATFQAFLDTLEQYRITYEDITANSLKSMSETPLFPYENRDQIRLCRLYRTLSNDN